MVNIRTATENDKKPVLRLLDELLTYIEDTQKHGSHDPVEEVGSDLFNEVTTKNSVKIFVAEENSNIVGVATFFLYPIVRRGQYRGQLEELVVTKSMRGKGVGSKLLEAVKLYCKENKIHSFRLNSGIELTETHKFYEANGGKFTEKMFRFDL